VAEDINPVAIITENNDITRIISARKATRKQQEQDAS